MMFGLVGVLVRIVLRVLLRQGLEYAFTSERTRVNPAVVQGLGLIVAGGVVGGGSFLLLWPVIFGSTIYLIFYGLVVSAIVGGGVIRLAIGLFSVGDTESRSGPAMSPVNYYVALPEEMPAGYCWQCGRRVKLDSLICLRCGATQPKGAQQRAMMSAPTLERGGGDSGHWPQWQPEEEEDPLQRLGPGPMGPGRFPGGAPYPPPGPGAPYPPPGPGMPYPPPGPGGPYPPPGPGAPYPTGAPYPPQHMPPRGPGFPAFPLPSRPMGRPPRGAPFPGAPFPPRQQPPARGRPSRESAPRERPPREKKPSRPRWGR